MKGRHWFVVIAVVGVLYYFLIFKGGGARRGPQKGPNGVGGSGGMGLPG